MTIGGCNVVEAEIAYNKAAIPKAPAMTPTAAVCRAPAPDAAALAVAEEAAEPTEDVRADADASTLP